MAHSEKDQDKKKIQSSFESYIHTTSSKTDLEREEDTTNDSSKRLKLEWIPRAYRDIESNNQYSEKRACDD